MSLKIDSEFKNLIPALTEAEYQQLEENIIQDGCLHELIAWDSEDIIIDGHNRHEICHKHNIPFKVKYLSFDGRSEAKIWIIKNQFGRRNLPIEVRVTLAFKLEEEIREKAKESQTRKPESVLQPVGKQKIHTDKELGKFAGVSHETIREARVIKEEGTEEQKRQFETGKKKIKTIYKEIRKPKEAPIPQEETKPLDATKTSETDVDFSFLLEEPQKTEEDKELSNALHEMASKAELMEEFEKAICVPIVGDALLKFLKETLSRYPDTLENSDNADRKSFVNAFNILKKIIRKGE